MPTMVHNTTISITILLLINDHPLQHIIHAQSLSSRLKKTKMNISMISKEVARSRWVELFLAVATASSLSSVVVVVVADEAAVSYLQPTRHQSSNSYESDQDRALMRDDEQPSESEEEPDPDVASIID